MAEKLGPTFVLLTVFVAMSALLVASLGKVFYYNVRSVESPEGYEGDTIIGEYVVSWWHPNPDEGGHDIDTDLIISNGRLLTRTALATGPPEDYWFWKEGTISDDEEDEDRNRVQVFLVRNNTDYLLAGDMAYKDIDYIMVAQNVGDWWGSKWRRATINYAEILANEKDNISATQFDLGWRNFTLFVQTPYSGMSNFSNYLWANNFTIYLGQQIGNEEAGSTSVWSIIGRLLSFKLIEVETPNSIILNFAISFPIWIAIGFIVMTLLSRFLPLVSGG